VCAYQMPAGFVKVDDYWDPTRCGNPTSIIYNVWVIESFYDKRPGEYISACAWQVPFGWQVVGTQWDPTRCGHPTSIYSNVWTIQRVF
jgi:hypothetical protein